MNGLITLFVMIILSGVAFSMAYLYITNDRVLNLSIGNSTKYNSTMPKCGIKKPIISEPIDSSGVSLPIPSSSNIRFYEQDPIILRKTLRKERIDSSNNNISIDSPESIGSLESSACPNLDNYVHRSQLKPQTFIRNNPYYVSNKIKSGKYPECPKCPNTLSPFRINSMYETDRNIPENKAITDVWIPAVGPNCDM